MAGQQGRDVAGVGQATPNADQGEQDGQKAKSGRRWIADTFEGAVYVHNVDGAGTSRVLQAGDEIPEGSEGQIRSHIPTTGSQPRSSRLREFDAGLDGGRQAPTFDPRDHTVHDVNAYLDDNPEDVQRVLDLERSGAARIGVLKRD
jgi:hypothetical protein